MVIVGKIVFIGICVTAKFRADGEIGSFGEEKELKNKSIVKYHFNESIAEKPEAKVLWNPNMSKGSLIIRSNFFLQIVTLDSADTHF